MARALDIPGITLPIQCLDHGYVQLLDKMGDDQSIVDDARVSISGEKVQATSTNRALIRYLMRFRHTTPIEGVVFKFIMKMPIFTARQFVRHRTATINEMSARYGELPREFYVPELVDICYQSNDNKQGRSGPVEPEIAEIVQRMFREDAECCMDFYDGMLGHNRGDQYEDAGDSKGVESYALRTTPEERKKAEDHLKENNGVARELARINLPLSTYTLWRWQINLHNLLHFLSLRLDGHAQKEARVYGEAIAKIVQYVVPIAWEAFEDFRLYAMTFSRHECIVLRFLLTGCPDWAQALDAVEWPTKRERQECEAKLGNLLGRK